MLDLVYNILGWALVIILPLYLINRRDKRLKEESHRKREADRVKQLKDQEENIARRLSNMINAHPGARALWYKWHEPYQIEVIRKGVQPPDNILVVHINVVFRQKEKLPIALYLPNQLSDRFGTSEDELKRLEQSIRSHLNSELAKKV